MPGIGLNKPEALCKAIKRVLEDSKQKPVLTARPYDFYNPDSAWWLIPSTEWPAYKYGKFDFRYPDLAHGKDKRYLTTGILVEKGITKEWQRRYGLKDNLVMESTWRWHSFLEDIESGFFINTLSRIKPLVPVELWLGYGYETAKERPKNYYEQPSNDYKLSFSREMMRFELLEEPRVGVIEVALTGTTLSAGTSIEAGELVTGINRILSSPNAQGLWFNIWVVSRFEITGPTGGSPHVNVFQPEEIWDVLLKPLSLWVL